MPVGSRDPHSFVHVSSAARVIFGVGAARQNLLGELERMNARRALVIASQRDSELVDGILAPVLSLVAGRFEGVRPHVPLEAAEDCRSQARDIQADVVIAVGGGSTIGMAKAVALVSEQPIIALPTTYSGSEATPVWGLTIDGLKTTGIDPVVQPKSVIYDPELTYDMPISLTVASGLNALAHSVEALWAPGGTPVSDAFALTSIESLAKGLRQVSVDGGSREARERLLVGAWLAGAAFAVAGSGLHHKICHVLGGAFNLPHAETHAIVLPHVMAFNLEALPESDRLILQRLNAVGLGGARAIDAMTSLLRELDAPRALTAVGLRAEQLETAVNLVFPKVPKENPRPVSRKQVGKLLGAALVGPGTGL